MYMPKHVYALFLGKDDAVTAYNEIMAAGCNGEHCSMILR